MSFRPAANATTRFSDRVENYIKYRPGYPPELLDLMRNKLGLVPEWLVADIGSGTGILSEVLLRNGNTVIGVEPNKDMREAAARLLASYPRFRSVAGTAEATGLNAASVDLITAGQAFHWFDPPRARAECLRILKPRGHVLLVWNDRKTEDSPFLTEYERLMLEYGTDYTEINHRNVDDDRLRPFFGPDGWKEAHIPNAQHFDWDGIYGRLMSSSYAPAKNDPRHAPLVKALRQAYDTHQINGQVPFLYDTHVLYGPIT